MNRHKWLNLVSSIWKFSMSIAAVKLDEAPVGEQEFGL